MSMAAEQQHQATNVRTIAGRQPPHDHDAERTCLGAVLMGDAKPGADETIATGRAALVRLRGILAAEDFQLAPHQEIFRACCAIADADKPIDVVSVVGWLADHELLAMVGGRQYVAETLGELTLAVVNLEHHARTVRDKARLRTFIETVRADAVQAYGDVGPSVQAFLEGAGAKIASIAASTADDGATDAHGIARAALARVQEDATDPEETPGVATGIDAIDGSRARRDEGLPILGKPRRGDMTMVTAPPKCGKSVLVGDIVLNAARPTKPGRASVGGLIFGYEMSAAEYGLRWACDLGKIDASRIAGAQMTRDDWSALQGALDEIAKLPIAVDDRADKGEPIGVGQIEAGIVRERARMRRVFGVDLALVVIDVVQLVDYAGLVDRRATQEQGLNAVGRRLRSIARKHDVAMLCTAHLNDRGEIRYCSQFSAHAQAWWNIVLGERDDKYGTGPRPATLQAKRRRGAASDVSVGLWFHGAFSRFSDEERVT